MAFPSYEDIEEPLLSLLHLRGGSQHQMKAAETYEPLADYFNLSIQERNELRPDRNEPLWNNMVQWARKELNDQGYLDKRAGWGTWRLSAQGIMAAASLGARYKALQCGPMTPALKYQQPNTMTPSATDMAEPDPARRIKATTYRVLRDTGIARSIKVLYGYKCQICGDTVTLGDGQSYAEAHHVQPLGAPHNGPDTRENVLCVCPNHHVQLDYGAIAIDISDLKLLHPGHKLSSKYVDYHNATIIRKT